MQLDLSSKYDAFVCYFRANQQHLAFNNQMRNKKKIILQHGAVMLA